MRQLLFWFVVGGLLLNHAFAMPTISIEASIADQVVTPGMPVYVYVEIDVESLGRQPAPTEDKRLLEVTFFVPPGDLELRGPDGSLAGARPEDEWVPIGLEARVAVPLQEPDRFTKTLILHQWHSTDLPQGKYDLRLRVEKVVYRWRTEGSAVTPYQECPVGRTWRFPLKIGTPDPKKVNAEFEALLEECLVADGSEEAYYRAYRAADTLVFAQGFSAPEFQLKVLELMTKFPEKVPVDAPRVLTMSRNIVRKCTPELARAAIEMAESETFKKDREKRSAHRSGGCKWLTWIIHEMNSRGGEEVKDLTQAFVDSVDLELHADRGYFMDWMGKEPAY